MTIIRSALFLLICVAIGACGFHLRGSTAASIIESAYVVAAPAIAIAPELRTALTQAGVQLAAERTAAQVTVTLLEDRTHRQTITVTAQARTAEFEISREVTYRVESADGAVLIDDRAIRGVRIYRVDTSNLVGSNQEEQLLMRELSADVVAQIMRSIDAAVGAKT